MKKDKVFIIAELGINHNGNLNLAKKMINSAKKAGADAVKFQIFKTENVVTKDAKLCDYQKKDKLKKDNSLFKLLKKLELNYSSFRILANHCRKKKIEFMCTADESEGLNEIKKMIKKVKIGSAELNDLYFLEKIAKLNKLTFLSTGLSDINQVKKSRNHLIKNGLSKDKIFILHCTSAYPAPDKDLNLNVLKSYFKLFGKNIGYSDHNSSIISSVIAVSLGAKVIEKHFTLDKKLIGPDHKSSLNPKEFKNMVRDIRRCELMLGSNKKIITNSEIKNIKKIRKGIYAKKNIFIGEKFSEKNICIKRPYNGSRIENFKKIIGNKSLKCYQLDDGIFE